MGWLELLPLLKRALPLLDRLAPMLEATIAGRGATRAELERSAAATVDVAKSQEEIMRALAAHADRLTSISEDVKRLNTPDESLTSRLLSLEYDVRSLKTMLKTVSIIACVLLTATIGLLILLLSRHA